jgi:hypothetical protein
VAVGIAFLGAVTAGDSPLKPVQMLWVNLIMDTMGALALATEQPHPDLLKRKPYGRDEKFITNSMWKNILGQAVFQFIVLVLELHAMQFFSFFGLPGDKSDWGDSEKDKHRTIIFNTFVFMQLFNEINCRKLESKEWNVFERIHKNFIFQGVIAFTVIVQFLLVQFAGAFASTTPLTVAQWFTCIIIGGLALPIGLGLRLLPTPVDKIPPRRVVLPEDEEEEATPKQGEEAAKHPETAVLTTEKPAAALADSLNDNMFLNCTLKPNSNWKRAQQVRTQIAVIQAMRRGGRVSLSSEPLVPTHTGH